MRDKLPCELPAGYDSTPVPERLARVLDPELDESVLDLGFIRSLQLRSRHAALPVFVSPVLGVRVPEMHMAVDYKEIVAVMSVHVSSLYLRGPML